MCRPLSQRSPRARLGRRSGRRASAARRADRTIAERGSPAVSSSSSSACHIKSSESRDRVGTADQIERRRPTRDDRDTCRGMSQRLPRLAQGLAVPCAPQETCVRADASRIDARAQLEGRRRPRRHTRSADEPRSALAKSSSADRCKREGGQALLDFRVQRGEYFVSEEPVQRAGYLLSVLPRCRPTTRFASPMTAGHPLAK